MLLDDDPAYDITVSSETEVSSGCEACLTGAIESALTRHRITSARVSVVIVDDAEIARLNERHLGRPEPTDVLAFDLRSDTTDSELEGPDQRIEGDVVVSIQTARREAEHRGHGVDAELALYAVHGTLHLLGYDDQEPDGASRMHTIEDEILTERGLGAVYKAPPR